MNIDNISQLGKQLGAIGFENLETVLIKRICFRPAAFQLNQCLQRSADQLFFRFHFERPSADDHYQLQFYDVSLQKEEVIAETFNNKVDIHQLASAMKAIDWKTFFSNEGMKWQPDIVSTYENELSVEHICEQLTELSTTAEGCILAGRFIRRYWSGNLPDEIAGIFPTLKSKGDISQRFYFSADNIITADEAYRFLQNKVFEKQSQQKGKQLTHSRVMLADIGEKKKRTDNQQPKQKKINVS